MLVVVVVTIMSVLFTVQKHAARETLSGLERRYSASLVGFREEEVVVRGEGRKEAFTSRPGRGDHIYQCTRT